MRIGSADKSRPSHTEQSQGHGSIRKTVSVRCEDNRMKQWKLKSEVRYANFGNNS